MHAVNVRLERFYCSPTIHKMAQNSEYLPKTISDHSLLLLTSGMTRTREPIPAWSLRSEMLDDQIFRESMRTVISNYFSENGGSTESRHTEWEAFKTVVRGQCTGTMIGVRPTLLQDVEKQEETLKALEKEAPKDPALTGTLIDERRKWAKSMQRVRSFDHKTYLVRSHSEINKTRSVG